MNTYFAFKKKVILLLLFIPISAFSADTSSLVRKQIIAAKQFVEEGNIDGAYKKVNGALQLMNWETPSTLHDSVIEEARKIYIIKLNDLLVNFDSVAFLDIKIMLDKYPELNNSEIQDIISQIGNIQNNKSQQTQKKLYQQSQESITKPIVCGFGIFYKTEYSEGLNQIKSDGFTILEESVFRDTNTDRKIIRVDSFEYDGLPYLNGTFCFDRAIDRKYYFTFSEGDVDTDKINNEPEFAAKFSIFLQSCNQQYELNKEEYNNVQLVGYKGINSGYILLAISDKLHIIYSPKGPLE